MVAIHETSYSIPDAPRIALIADLHNTGYKAVVDSINRRIPEIICIVGDIVRGQKTEDDKSLVEIQENVVPLLKGCAETAPTFMSLGNHEQHFDEQDAALVASTGVTLLDNAFTEIIVDRKKMVIGGLTSATCTDYRRAIAALSSEQRGKSRYPACDVSSIQKELPETEWLKRFAQQDGYKLLLSHHPEYFPFIPEAVNLILSGHAHGGQIRIYNPFHREWVGLIAHGQGFWPKWSRGIYENGRLIVSAGLSNTFSIPRLFNPREMVYINCDNTKKR